MFVLDSWSCYYLCVTIKTQEIGKSYCACFGKQWAQINLPQYIVNKYSTYYGFKSDQKNISL